MSRCFPFPPPGYEKKPTIDKADLLKKEKHKEKKHKKDKKDREKREGKEKKEKSDGKHKEKKDKKDKHRDKKKDKENGKDKEKVKSNHSDEKRVDGKFEGFNGEMLHQNNEHNKQKEGSSDHKKSSVQFRNGEHKKEESSKENFKSSDDKKSTVKLWGQNEELVVRNRFQAEMDIDNSKFVKELGRRIRDEEKGTGSLQFPVESRKVSEIPKMDGPRITNEETFGRLVMVQNMIDGTMPHLDKWADKKAEMREKENDDKRGDKRKNKDRDKQRHGKDKDKDKDKTKEEKMKKKNELIKTERDKNKYTKNNDTIGSLKDLSTHSPNVGGNEMKKRKDMETNGFSHENEPRPNKMARPASCILTENGRKQDFLQNPGLNLAGKQGASMGSSFKVDSKERKVNGVIPSQPMTLASKKPPITTANHIKPTTVKSPPVSIDHVATKRSPIPATKPPSSVPNHIPIPIQPFSDPSAKPSSTVSNQNQPHSLPISTKPSPVVAVANKIAAQPLPNSKKKPPAEPSIRPPHPDTKYLKQILTVPKMEPWSGLDDQEWLTSSSKDKPHFKKTTRDDALQDNKEVEVWSEAKHLESVDICALPYVIPY